MGYDDMLLNRYLSAQESGERLTEEVITWVLGGGHVDWYDDEDGERLHELADGAAFDRPNDQNLWDHAVECYTESRSPY